MANSPTFVAHALDLLSLVGPAEARAMFGGHGVYARGVMFALLDDDELFLKVDAEVEPRFAEAGCRRWTYPSPKGPMPTSYFRPPDEAHEDAETMLSWARLGLQAALRAQAAKAARGGARRPRATGKKAAAARPAKKAPAKAKRPVAGRRGKARTGARGGRRAR